MLSIYCRRYNKLFKYVTTAKNAVSTGRQKAPPFNRTLNGNRMRSQKIEKKDILLQAIILPLFFAVYYLFSKLPYYMVNEYGYKLWLWAFHPIGKCIYILVWSSTLCITLGLLWLGYCRFKGIEPRQQAVPEYVDVRFSLITKISIGILVVFLIVLFLFAAFSESI
jgi:cell division protein FtsL